MFGLQINRYRFIYKYTAFNIYIILNQTTFNWSKLTKCCKIITFLNQCSPSYHSQINKDNYHLKAHAIPKWCNGIQGYVKTTLTSTASTSSTSSRHAVPKSLQTQIFMKMRLCNASKRSKRSHFNKNPPKYKSWTDYKNSSKSVTNLNSPASSIALNLRIVKRPSNKKSWSRTHASSDLTMWTPTLNFKQSSIHLKDIKSPKSAEPKCATGWLKFVPASNAHKEPGS